MIELISFQHEEFKDCILDIDKLLDAHADEVEDMYITPNYDVYQAGDEQDALRIYTMRNGEELVGYSAFWLMNHPHHDGKIFAANDLVYIRPEHRGEMAMKFFEYVERQLEGVDAITYTFKVEHDHPELMEYLGMTHTEKVYTKVLG